MQSYMPCMTGSGIRGSNPCSPAVEVDTHVVRLSKWFGVEDENMKEIVHTCVL